MDRRTSFISTRRRPRSSRARWRTVVALGVTAGLGAVLVGVVVPEPSTAATRTRGDDIGVVLDCVRMWVRDAGQAFEQGGICDAAQQALARRVTAAPTPTPSASTTGPRQAAPSKTSRAAAPTPARVTSTPVPSALPAGTQSVPLTAPSPSEATTTSPSPTGVTATPSPSAASPSSDSGSGAAPAFGSRPASDAITCRDQTGVVIRNRTFKDIRNDVPAITIVGCRDVTIIDNDFIGDAEPIYVRDSTNVRIIGNRYRDITGPFERNGSHRGNFTQWENSFGGVIRGNTGIGGDTEDVISIYASGGIDAANPLIIEDNHFQGTNWRSASGSGIMLGDGGGSHVVVRNNVLVDIGQVGIGVAGGSDIHVVDNTVYGSARKYSNVGIYAWGQGAACSDIEVARNRVDFVKDTGQGSSLWHGDNCGVIAGWDTNVFPRLDPTALAVVL